MKTVWIVQAFRQEIAYQLAELTMLMENGTGFPPSEVWVFGRDADAVLPSDALFAPIRFIPAPDEEPETLLVMLEQAYLESVPGLLCFPSGDDNGSLAARLAFRLQGCSLLGVSGISSLSPVTAVKKCYNGHMEANFELLRSPVCVSAEKFVVKPQSQPARSPTQEELWRLACPDNLHPWLIGAEWEPLPEADGLSAARFIVAAGRGAGKDGIASCRRVAAAAGGKLGSSRPVAISGWNGMDSLLGVSGTMAAPDICLIAGASGAAAFFQGVEKSRFIVAVNTDEKAPALRDADVGVVGDCRQIMDALCLILENRTNKAI